jgi:O-antigen ligase
MRYNTIRRDALEAPVDIRVGTFRRQLPPLTPELRIGLVIGGLVLMSLVIGLLSGNGRGNITLAIPLLLLAVYLLLNRFSALVLVIPIAALAVPLDVPTGTFTKLPAALLITLALCGIWIASMWIRKGFRLNPSALNRPMLYFCVTITLSLVWGIIWRDPILRMDLFKNFIMVQSASLITYWLSVGAALLVGNFVLTSTRLKILFGLFIGFGTLMTFTQLLSIPQNFLNDRGLWSLWTVLPAYAILIAQPKVRWYWRLLLLLLIVLNLYQTVFNNLLWKSGWIPTIIGLVVATFLRSKRLFVLLLVGFALIYLTQISFFAKMAEDEVNEGADERIGIWTLSWSVIRDHWLFGTGPAGYAPYNMTYFPYDARSTHNNYIDILSQFGFVGMAIWLWLGAAGIYEGWRVTQQAPPGFLRTAGITATAGWVAAQCAMFFGDWILPFAYNQTITGYKYTVYSWLFLGTIISLRYILAKAEPQPQAAGATA